MREQLTITHEQYLNLKMMQRGYDIFLSMEAVASTAMAHPEWDMKEKKTWEEWEATDN